MIWRIFIIAAVLAAAAVLMLLRREHPEQVMTVDDAPAPPEPGYFMTDARIVQTGADGAPLYRMNAERIQQNPDDLTIQLQNLHLDYYPAANGTESTNNTSSGKRPATGTPSRSPSVAPAPGSHWTLSARTGHMPQDATQVELEDDVEIKGNPQVAGGASSAATLRTSRLSVNLQSQVATTRERVDITWGDRRLSAVGLTADLKAGRVKLESAVHGLFTH